MGRKSGAQVRYVVGEILKVYGDMKSRAFYRQVAQSLPDERIFQFLAEIRQDGTIRNRGAVFTTKVKDYLARHTGDAKMR